MVTIHYCPVRWDSDSKDFQVYWENLSPTGNYTCYEGFTNINGRFGQMFGLITVG